MLYRVYVDEAGDRGISPTSDKHFVVSAVIVADQADAQVRLELDSLRVTLGRKPGHVLHFRKLSHSQRLKAVQDIAQFSLATITNVIIHKGLIRQPMPAGNMAFISQADPMYLWALRLLLERISWDVDEYHGTKAVVTFGHVKGFKAHKLHSYRGALEYTASIDLEPREPHVVPNRTGWTNLPNIGPSSTGRDPSEAWASSSGGLWYRRGNRAHPLEPAVPEQQHLGAPELHFGEEVRCAHPAAAPVEIGGRVVRSARIAWFRMRVDLIGRRVPGDRRGTARVRVDPSRAAREDWSLCDPRRAADEQKADDGAEQGDRARGVEGDLEGVDVAADEIVVCELHQAALPDLVEPSLLGLDDEVTHLVELPSGRLDALRRELIGEDVVVVAELERA